MKIINFDGNEEKWLEARMGKITGTRLKDLIVKRGIKPKLGFYEIIAERVAIPLDNVGMLDRGKTLEQEAIELFAKKTGKEVNTDLVLWHRDDNENIAISPDGSIGKTEAVETKCLGHARHIEAYLTQEIPSEYEYQVLQYFIVNEKLKTLYFIFYDPQMPKDLFWIVVNRDEVKEKIDEVLELQRKALEDIEEIEKKLTF